jgi:glycosyltransferase involved in cell wall biosynthesis
LINGKKILVVLPAYNAERTLERTWSEIPKDLVDEVLLVDDSSADRTAALAKELGIRTFLHDQNYGYGRNQKTCYREALRLQADIVIMLHPDYQYTPRLITAMASMIAFDVYDVVLGSRIIGGGALKGGMPVYKYIANRFLTGLQNLILGSKLSEFHTGYRAFSRRVLSDLPHQAKYDGFVFVNEILGHILFLGFRGGGV